MRSGHAANPGYSRSPGPYTPWHRLLRVARGGAPFCGHQHGRSPAGLAVIPIGMKAVLSSCRRFGDRDSRATTATSNSVFVTWSSSVSSRPSSRPVLGRKRSGRVGLRPAMRPRRAALFDATLSHGRQDHSPGQPSPTWLGRGSRLANTPVRVPAGGRANVQGHRGRRGRALAAVRR